MNDYSWASGVQARCRCGQDGKWLWVGTHGFWVDHGSESSPRCSIASVTAREERGLRQAVARQSRVTERGRRGYKRGEA